MIDIDNRNYYELLGLERDASMEQIKQAFKDIALVYHPDSNFFDEILEEVELPADDMKLFKAITQAYNVLSNEEKRKAYDLTLSKKEVSQGINVTGEWIRPDGSTPARGKVIREKAPTITNLQKLQKQYEETVTAQSNLKAKKTETVSQLQTNIDGGVEGTNKLLIIAIVIALLLVIILAIILL